MTPTEKEIVKICDKIYECSGIEAVTYRAIKNARGGRGSYSTIGPAIHKWKSLRQIPLKRRFTSGSPDDEDAVLKAWNKARLAIEQSASEQIGALQAHCEELADENNFLKSKLLTIEKNSEEMLKMQERILEFMSVVSDRKHNDEGDK